MVTLADSSEAAGTAGDHSLFGDSLCVASAMCYSCYTVIMQRELREDDPDVPALFFGYVGVLVAVLGAPVVVLLHVLGSYDLTALNPTALGLALLNGECVLLLNRGMLHAAMQCQASRLCYAAHS